MERGLRALIEAADVKRMQVRSHPTAVIEGLQLARHKNLLSSQDVREIEALRTIRNMAAHAQPGWEHTLTQEAVDKVRGLAKKIGNVQE
jgi:hypothetical protein